MKMQTRKLRDLAVSAIQGAISSKDESISDVQIEISLDLNSQGLFLFILL